MKKVIMSGDALISVSLKQKYDGSIDYAHVKVDGKSLDEVLGLALCRGKDADISGYIEAESVAKVEIKIVPVKPLSISVLERSDGDSWRRVKEAETEPETDSEADKRGGGGLIPPPAQTI